MRNSRSLLKQCGLILSSIGISNVGEWIYFIALNLMILNDHGSALAVGLLYIIRPLATMFTNVVCFSFIDRLNKKKWLWLLDVARSFLMIGLLFNRNLFFIYSIVFLIQVVHAIHEPILISYLAGIIPEERRKKFNASHSLINSIGFLIGPAFTGFLLTIGTANFAISINAIALLISAAIKLGLPNYSVQEDMDKRASYLQESKVAFTYLKEFYQTRKQDVLFYLAVSMLFVLAAGSDSVEAAFATGVLLMSEAQYGVLLSISGAGYVTGALLNRLIVEKIKMKQLIILGGFIYTSGYLIFSISRAYVVSAIGFFFISFALSYINTGFRTYIQTHLPKEKIGQLTSSFESLIAVLEMSVVALVSGLATFFEIRMVLIGTQLLMFGIVFLIIILSKKMHFKVDLPTASKLVKN